LEIKKLIKVLLHEKIYLNLSRYSLLYTNRGGKSLGYSDLVEGARETGLAALLWRLLAVVLCVHSKREKEKNGAEKIYLYVI
jgi:hypothetical protein